MDNNLYILFVGLVVYLLLKHIKMSNKIKIKLVIDIIATIIGVLNIWNIKSYRVFEETYLYKAPIYIEVICIIIFLWLTFDLLQEYGAYRLDKKANKFSLAIHNFKDTEATIQPQPLSLPKDFQG